MHSFIGTELLKITLLLQRSLEILENSPAAPEE